MRRQKLVALLIGVFLLFSITLGCKKAQKPPEPTSQKKLQVLPQATPSSEIPTVKEEKETSKTQLFQKQYTAGCSVEKRVIRVIELGEGEEATMIFGVFHGDEPQGKYMVLQLYEYLLARPELLKGKKVVLIPVANPDGLARGTRKNANKVDFNRNFPTKDWTPKYQKERYFPGVKANSEPETKVVISLIKRYKPDKIVTIHAPLHNINYDGPAKELANEMAKYNRYPVKANIGYPVHGSLGIYAGVERKIPTVTLELPNVPGAIAWTQNKDALLSAIKFNVVKNKKRPNVTTSRSLKGERRNKNTFFIKVDRSDNILYLYENGELTKKYIVSTGRRKEWTRLGTFKIIRKQKRKGWIKTEEGKWIKRNGKLDKYGPFFLRINYWHPKTKRQYGIHGTKEPERLGKPASNGCVRMSNEEVEELYSIVPVGTVVKIVK